ncbi:MAG TPA: AAA family ATPase [Afipia sp.]
MILTVGNVKGGCGKTTVSTNLAILRAALRKDVLLVDGDEQGTASLFTQLRAEQLGAVGYTAVSLHGAAVRTQVQRLRDKYDDVIIDVGGRDTGSLRAALTVAHLLLIPVQPRSFDLWSVDQVMKLAEEAKTINPDLKVMAFLNSADSQGRDNSDALAELAGIEGLAVAKPVLVRRKAYPNAAAAGRGITEMTPKDAKALEELTGLARVAFR